MNAIHHKVNKQSLRYHRGILKRIGATAVSIAAIGLLSSSSSSAGKERVGSSVPSGGSLTLFSAPLRLVDTRTGSGYFDAGNHYSNDTLRTYNIVTLAGGSVPGNATAIIGRATVVNASAAGGLQESPNPPVSGNDLGQGTAIINFPAGSVIGALGATFTSALDGGGQIRVHSTISGTADVIIDIVGYYQ